MSGSKRFVMPIVAAISLMGCESDGARGSGDYSPNYYGPGYYDSWYYGGYDYDDDIVVSPPPRPDRPHPAHPIVRPSPRPMPSISTGPRPSFRSGGRGGGRR